MKTSSPPSTKYRFEKTFCSQCGSEFGPGDHGYSSCKEHADDTDGLIHKLRAERYLTDKLIYLLNIVWDSKCNFGAAWSLSASETISAIDAIRKKHDNQT